MGPSPFWVMAGMIDRFTQGKAEVDWRRAYRGLGYSIRYQACPSTAAQSESDIVNHFGVAKVLFSALERSFN